MSADSDDALGLIRTNELLKADEFYGARQLWGTEVDFGFSKTQQESFAKWGHDRVLFDAVLAVRLTRPQIILSTFVGGITDGHGQHQVSGEIAQEVFKAAADPKVFPEQLRPVKDGGYGLEPWQPLAVYSRTPFAPVTEKGMFDYATGKWAPAKFHNYITGEWIAGVPSSDATIPVGTSDLTLGRSYVQIAREGWGEQKSQNGGANPSLSGPESTSYHLWGVAPEASPKAGADHNRMPISFTTARSILIRASARLPGLCPPRRLHGFRRDLHQIENDLTQFESRCPCHVGVDAARALRPFTNKRWNSARKWRQAISTQRQNQICCLSWT